MTVNFQDIPFQNIVRFGQRTMLSRPLFSTSWILGGSFDKSGAQFAG
jgi:hypothetical protein